MVANIRIIHYFHTKTLILLQLLRSLHNMMEYLLVTKWSHNIFYPWNYHLVPPPPPHWMIIASKFCKVKTWYVNQDFTFSCHFEYSSKKNSRKISQMKVDLPFGSFNADCLELSRNSFLDQYMLYKRIIVYRNIKVRDLVGYNHLANSHYIFIASQ